MGSPAVGFFGNASPLVNVDINASSNGNNTILANTTSKRIVVLSGDIVCSGAVTITWESSGGTFLDGPKSFAANGGQIYPETQHGHFMTLPGESLILNLNGPVQVGGHLVCGFI